MYEFYELIVDNYNDEEEKRRKESKVLRSRRYMKQKTIRFRMFSEGQNEYYECPFCFNLFIGVEFLKKHIINRHPDLLA